MMLANYRKTTLQVNYTDVVNNAGNNQGRNVVLMLDDGPHPIDNSEKDLTRKEIATVVQLRWGYYIRLGFYKSSIQKDTTLNTCADCDKTLHYVKELFENDTVRSMDQTNGLHPGNQLSRGGDPD